MHLNPQIKSNIFSTSILFLKLIADVKTTTKIFLNFSCIFTDICWWRISFSFYHLLYEGLDIWFHLKLWFCLEIGASPTVGLELTIWPPDGHSAKGPGKVIYTSETHSHKPLSLALTLTEEVSSWSISYNIIINFSCSSFLR